MAPTTMDSKEYQLLRIDEPRLEHLGFEREEGGSKWIWYNGKCPSTFIAIEPAEDSVTWFQGCDLCDPMAEIVIDDMFDKDLIGFIGDDYEETVHHYPDEEHYDDTLVCAACGSEIDPDFRYCHECGEFVEPVERGSLEDE